MARKIVFTLEGFWDRVTVLSPDECWPWNSHTFKGGYGYLYLGRGQRMGAHVFSLILKTKRYPKSKVKEALHSCDNPICCNPKHLSWGTRKKNISDCVKRRRHDPKPGERSNFHVLTEKEVKEIRASYIKRYGEISKLARQYKVHRHTISRIIKRETWENAR